MKKSVLGLFPKYLIVFVYSYFVVSGNLYSMSQKLADMLKLDVKLVVIALWVVLSLLVYIPILRQVWSFFKKVFSLDRE